ncbi:hypothetical protein [Caldimonas sp. KR1-144]|uniref:hypothetical protein n=1 Tax=Caldimonas sp. KR1-144 TaxID=3400911 RepID=UPI003C0963EF
MLRYLLRMLLLLAVFHHGVALPGTWQGGVAPEQDGEHAVMHWQQQAHHHHDDGSVHEHAGPQSNQHLQVDCTLHCPALIAVLPAAALPAPARAPLVPRTDAQPSTAFLELPERPPRRLS